ncbi:hypothetical protein RDI58_019601 [Solanum bulbocastanum]|uniref:Uncharacterized protein n=1 Tax=Solanum bulbocastanum TaxID=147425 RepID=A0AAN8T500_SOLBU
MGRRNDEALAIGKYLHALHHLQLIGNNMANEGLRAILDSCPHLISDDVANVQICQARSSLEQHTSSTD